MPKFATYQRPAPVNKASWGGKPGGSPYQPGRRPQLPPVQPTLPGLNLKSK